MKIFNQTFIYHTLRKTIVAILLPAVIVIIVSGCIPDTMEGEINKTDPSIISDPPDFSGSQLIIEDINGEDLYPGDGIMIKLILKNSGDHAVENIITEILQDEIPLIFEDVPGFKTERLDSDAEVVLETSAKIAGGIEEDLQGNIDLSIHTEVNEEFHISKSIEILGVREYERNLIPINMLMILITRL